MRVGDHAPAVAATGTDGNFLRAQPWGGKTVLLAFWSMDDPAGLRQLEALRAIRREFARDDRLRIISLCTDDDWATWYAFLEAQGMVDYGEDRGRFYFYMDNTWWHASEASHDYDTADAYGVAGRSKAFLVGPDGRFLAARLDDDELRGTVASALKGHP